MNSFRNLWDYNRRFNIHVIDIPEGEEVTLRHFTKEDTQMADEAHCNI